jgi:hypothetical protein
MQHKPLVEVNYSLLSPNRVNIHQAPTMRESERDIGMKVNNHVVFLSQLSILRATWIISELLRHLYAARIPRVCSRVVRCPSPKTLPSNNCYWACG